MAIPDPGWALVGCPECAAWPMAVNMRETFRFKINREATFSCSRCGFLRVAIVSAAGGVTTKSSGYKEVQRRLKKQTLV